MNKVIPIAIGIVIVAIAAGIYYATTFEKDLTATENIEPPSEQKGKNYTVDVNEGLSLAEP